MIHDERWSVNRRRIVIVLVWCVSAPVLGAAQSSNGQPARDLQLRGTVVHVDPSQSVAFIEEGRTHQVRAFHVGDLVQDQQLIAIADGSVTLSGNGQPVAIQMWHAPKSQGPQTASELQAVADELMQTIPPLDADAQRNVKAAVQGVSSTERLVNRPAVLAALKDHHPFQVIREAHVQPVVNAGQLRGVQLRGLPQRGLLRHCGFEEGDVITAINGTLPSTVGEALQLTEDVKQQDLVDVQIQRNGRPLKLRYHLQSR